MRHLQMFQDSRFEVVVVSTSLLDRSCSCRRAGMSFMVERREGAYLMSSLEVVLMVPFMLLDFCVMSKGVVMMMYMQRVLQG
mmetsp:Transcript_74281/g.215245  ORF Transcript_74281/g.215245 Transcript_74281/m.215245 type:complete len:82 (-) Transcript_74281:260-505(-)